jgi:hypothetical protein
LKTKENLTQAKFLHSPEEPICPFLFLLQIGLIFRLNFKGPWHNWEKIDSTYRDELFKEFKV